MSRRGVVDVHYPDDGGAWAALVVCDDERFASVVAEHVVTLAEVAPYEPGRFYLRELPAIRAVLDVADPVSLLVVDGYVDLAPGGTRPGLGARCHEAFGLPVLGLAKTAFQGATHAVPVVRGGATKPVYVTAAGLPIGRAAALVAGMAGPYRLPDVVRRVDALARGHALPQSRSPSPPPD